MNKPKKYKLNVDIKKAFGNLYRKGHTLIFCIDENNNILLGAKPHFYPVGITRLLGGGMKPGETDVVAALRELKEETGVELPSDQLIPLAIVDTEAKTDTEQFSMTTYLFAAKVKRTETKAGDDVKSIVGLTKKQFEELIQKYHDLKEDFWYEGIEGSHSWGDYGKVYGFIHEIALKEALNKGLVH